MKTSAITRIACLVLSFRSAVAFIGLGIDMYKPPCAHACRRAIEPNMLSCSDPEASMSGHSHSESAMTSPRCRAEDTAFLTTLAWCMSTECAQFSIPTSSLETFWEEECTGDASVAPKWDFGTAVRQVTGPPTKELAEEQTLNSTLLVPQSTWRLQYGTLTYMEEEERVHARYGIVICVTGFAVPIILTWLNYLPFVTRLIDHIKPYVVYPSTLRTYQVRPLPYLLGNAPTVGQGFYIALMLILNIILSAANYKTVYPFAWYTTQPQELLSFIMYRTGMFAFALFPLLLLFSSRNNILLWLSNWSHSTYLLLHRWIARIFGIQVLLHSILALGLYIDADRYPAEEKLPYWIWGAVATVAVSIMLGASGLYVRRWSYEIFLITHIVLAAFVMVGCWYHVVIQFEYEFGYELWLYAACAVWFFDRLIRVLRIAKNGMRYAQVSDIGNAFVRLDIPGIRWADVLGKHAYVFFPTLNPLKPWENHPFSVLPTALLNHRTTPNRRPSNSEASEHSSTDPEKQTNTKTLVKPVIQDNPTTAGITLFIRKGTGLTTLLKAQTRLLTLLDGPYPNNPHTAILTCDRILLIGGGIGITGLLAWPSHHPNTKLYWSVKTSAQSLVESLEGALSNIREKEVRIGERLDIGALLAEEVEMGWMRIGVVVCGPGGMCDAVRAEVVRVGKGMGRGCVFELGVDAYSW